VSANTPRDEVQEVIHGDTLRLGACLFGRKLPLVGGLPSPSSHLFIRALIWNELKCSCLPSHKICPPCYMHALELFKFVPGRRVKRDRLFTRKNVCSPPNVTLPSKRV